MVVTTAYRTAVGQGTGPILLNLVGCTGTESSLLNCSRWDAYYYYSFYYFECLFYDDVGVVCPSCKSCFNNSKNKVVTSELLSQLNNLIASNCE